MFKFIARAGRVDRRAPRESCAAPPSFRDGRSRRHLVSPRRFLPAVAVERRAKSLAIRKPDPLSTTFAEEVLESSHQGGFLQYDSRRGFPGGT